MAKFSLEFECDNDAFYEDMCGTIAEILTDLAHKMRDFPIDTKEMQLYLYDTNGNKIGLSKLTED